MGKSKTFKTKCKFGECRSAANFKECKDGEFFYRCGNLNCKDERYYKAAIEIANGYDFSCLKKYGIRSKWSFYDERSFKEKY